MHYCDHALSVVRPSSSVRQSSVVNFSHFWLLLRNRWTQFNETWQEARSLRSLPSLCFSGRSEKQNGRPGLWLAETFSTSLKLLNRIQRNLTGSQISTTSSKCVVFWPIRKTRWPPWPLICWDIFDFSSETAERNSMKLYRKQELTVLYQFCVFRRIGKTRWPPWSLIGWDIFDFSSETAERNTMKLDRKRDLNVLYQVCVFSGRSENKNGRPGWLLKKVAHCTQVHDMWLFGPIVLLFRFFSHYFVFVFYVSFYNRFFSLLFSLFSFRFFSFRFFRFFSVS